MINTENIRRRKDPVIQAKLTEQHRATLDKMATLMGWDPAQFSSIQGAAYADTIWARYFDQIWDLGPFTNQTDFINEMMVFYKDWYNETLAGNETTRRLFVNGMVSQAVEMFQTRIN